MENNNQIDNFIEKFALNLEKNTRLPHAGGKIFAYLLICDPPEQTAKQIINELEISKSSFSYMIRLLIESQIVQEINKKGIRSRHYKIKENGYDFLFLKKLQGLYETRLILEEGISLLNESGNANERIQNVHELYSFFEEEMILLDKKWKNKKGIIQKI